MKIAYICADRGIPVFGTKGASIHLREVVHALRLLGHDVRVYAFDADPAVNPDPATFRQVRLEGVAGEMSEALKHDVPAPEHLANEYNRLLYNEYLQRVLLPELQEWRPDFIYERYSLFGYAGIELAAALDVPLLLEVNAPLREEQERYRILALPETAGRLEHRILTTADALLVVSEPLLQFALDLGVEADRIIVQPNAVNLDRFSPEVPPPEGLREGGEKLVGFVGTLKQWHDVDTLVEAVGLLYQADPSYRLLMVGDGPRREALEALGAPYLRLYGEVDNGAVPGLLAAMDLVAVPYSNEDDPYFSPLKLFEAMAMAKPVVGARIGQVPLVLNDGADGLLYTPGDAADLARKIDKVFALPDRGAAMGAAARAAVARRYTWYRNAERIVERAESLLQASGAHR